MKGFPNQVAELPVLTSALKVLSDLLDQGENPRDDGVLGETLIRRQVLNTGHSPVPIEEYLAAQRAIPKKSNQSYRTRARGLRELFRVLGLINESDVVTLTPAGRAVVVLDTPLTPEGLRLWRSIILDMDHDGGDGETSHPYQVLLRLVANRPGISRAKCALALEARNDSDEEIDRITELSDKSESAIRREIGITESNWDNAKKILPRFAEQLGDVQKSGQSFHLSDIPGGGEDGDGRDGPADPNPLSTPPTPPAGRATTRTPRRSSAVTAGTIARTATTDSWDEANAIEQVELDPERQRSSKEKLMDRLRRHNLIVQNIASLMEQHGAELFENPFDCLACFPSEGLMWEVKSLDGTESDEIVRVREALAQLLYYEAFVTTPNVKYRLAKKIACFERKISDAHIKWLEDKGILVVWVDGDTLQGSERAMAELSAYLVA